MTAPLQTLLFGGAEVPATEAVKRHRPHTRAQGYGGSPGLGPEGETCGSCALCVGRTSEAGRTFWKCLKAKRRWTATPASDVRVRSPACEHWEAASDGARQPANPGALMRKKARKRRKTKGVRRLPERLE